MNAAPKEKGKVNPFASFLRPTEELLWHGTEKVTAVASVVPRLEPATMITIAIIVIFVTGIVVIEALKTRNTSIFTVIGSIILVLFAYWVRHGLRGGMMVPALRNNALYAITSERLFYQRGDDIRAVVLEKVISISSYTDQRDTRQLKFWRPFSTMGRPGRCRAHQIHYRAGTKAKIEGDQF